MRATLLRRQPGPLGRSLPELVRELSVVCEARRAFLRAIRVVVVARFGRQRGIGGGPQTTVGTLLRRDRELLHDPAHGAGHFAPRVGGNDAGVDGVGRDAAALELARELLRE